MRMSQWVVVWGMMVGTACADIMGPGWSSTDAGAVHAEWTDWTQFHTGFAYGADQYTAYDAAGNANNPASVALHGAADASSHGETFKTAGTGADGIQIEANWDFSLWVPSFAGMEVQDVYFQVTYWDDINDATWRQGWDFGATAYGSGSSLQGGLFFEGETHDVVNGLITEAYSFSMANSGEGFFIDFSADAPLSVSNPAYVHSIHVDGLSYDAVPEPSTVVCLLIGGVSFYVRKRVREQKEVTEL